MSITLAGDIAPRTPMSIVLSVREAGDIMARLDRFDTELKYDAAGSRTMVTARKAFGGHTLNVSFECGATDNSSTWVNEIEQVGKRFAEQMNELQYGVTPEITALLSIAGCRAEYDTPRLAWSVTTVRTATKPSKAVASIEENAPFETWQQVLSAFLDTQVPHFEEPQQ